VLIYHVATLADWTAAQAAGAYTTSTYGVSLAQEGFLHCSREDQWRGVLSRYYTDVPEPLVLLAIDTDLVTVPVAEEPPAPGVSETYPHVYGALDPAAVVEVRSLDETSR